MEQQVVFSIVTLTLGLLLATSHAFTDDVMMRSEVREIPTIAVLPQERPESSNSDDKNSMRNADDGEYVIFNSKGDPEAAVVVTKDAAKATEESNIRSIYEWMKRYIASNKNEPQNNMAQSNTITPKISPNIFQQQYMYPSYTQQRYPYSSYNQHQYNPYSPIVPYSSYRPGGIVPYSSYRPGGFYDVNPNVLPYQYGMSMGFPLGYYGIYKDTNRIMKHTQPYKPNVEGHVLPQYGPLNLHSVTPNQYQLSVFRKAPKGKTTPETVVRGAHTTPNGKPWPPVRKVQKNKNISVRIPVNGSPDYPAFSIHSNVANRNSDFVSADRFAARNSPNLKQMVSPNENMHYRSWLENQNDQDGGSFAGSDVNYDDQRLSAYLLSKFAPFVQPQIYSVKSVSKVDGKKLSGQKVPERYYTRSQFDEMINGRRYIDYPQYYSVEEDDSSEKKFSRYGGVKDEIGNSNPQHSYAVERFGGNINRNTNVDALKALTGHTKLQIDQMMDGGRGDYLQGYPSSGGKAYSKYEGERHLTAYPNKPSDGIRSINYPQLYAFPEVDIRSQKYSRPAYGGDNDQLVYLNGYLDETRQANYPQRYNIERPASVIRTNANHEALKALTGYPKKQIDEMIDGRSVDYQKLLYSLHAMDVPSNKNTKNGQQYVTRNTNVPKYISVAEDKTKQTNLKYDSVRAVTGYTKEDIARIIANNLSKHGTGGARFREQPNYGVYDKPWQQFRSSERSYPQYDQPWRENVALQSPVMSYGYY